jgi:hypothetical protein
MRLCRLVCLIMDDRVVVVSASSRNIAVDEERATSLHGSTTPQCVRYEYHPNTCDEKQTVSRSFCVTVLWSLS